jgi:hypothetical protein
MSAEHVTEEDLDALAWSHAKCWPGARAVVDCDTVMQLVREIRRLRSLLQAKEGQ